MCREREVYSDTIGYWTISPMPGNDSVCIFHNVYIHPEHRGKGHGKARHLKRLARAIELGYKMAVCTVRNDNKVQIKILEANGWMQGHWYSAGPGYNEAVAHNVRVYLKRL